MAADPPAVYTVREIARLLRIGRNQAYAMVRDGKLVSFRSGTAIRVPRAAVEHLLEGPPPPESAELTGDGSGPQSHWRGVG